MSLSTNKILSENSPFSQIPYDITILIMKNLTIKDLINLSLISRKWYQYMLSIPESMKQVVKSCNVLLTSRGFVTDRKYRPLFNPHSKFTFIRNWNIDELTISEEQGELFVKDLLNFLIDNLSRIQINTLVLKVPFDNDDDFELLQFILNQKQLQLCIFGNSNERMNENQKIFDETSFFHKNLNIPNLNVYVELKSETINMILKQCVEGTRNLNRLYYQMFRKDNFDLRKFADEITEGIEEYIDHKEVLITKDLMDCQIGLTVPGDSRTYVHLLCWP